MHLNSSAWWLLGIAIRNMGKMLVYSLTTVHHAISSDLSTLANDTCWLDVPRFFLPSNASMQYAPNIQFYLPGIHKHMGPFGLGGASFLLGWGGGHYKFLSECLSLFYILVLPVFLQILPKFWSSQKLPMFVICLHQRLNVVWLICLV